MPSPLIFTILAHDRESQARLGRIETPHGVFDTPSFMPIGTRAAVKGLTPQQVKSTGTQIVLANAYHLMLRPGEALLAPGGYHMTVDRHGRVHLDQGPAQNGVRPAVDPTMETVARAYGNMSVAVVLTGMGSDGLSSLCSRSTTSREPSSSC